MMQQIQIHNGVLQQVVVPIPQPGPKQVLIKVQAIGINRADLLQVEGLYPAPEAVNIPGLEVAGYDVKSGAKLCALLSGGGYSEYVAVDQSQTIAVPEWMEFSVAAALPEALTTAYMALVAKGGIAQLKHSCGGCIIVHGASSGVGSIIVQVAKSYGAYVLATVGDQERLSFCNQIGADEAHVYEEGKWVESVRAKGGASIVVDILGGPYLERNIKAIGRDGKIMVLAVMAGSVGNLPMGALLMKNAAVIGTTLRSQTNETKAQYIKAVTQGLWPKVLEGSIQPCIDSVFSFAEMEKAHTRLRERGHLGKVVVVI